MNLDETQAIEVADQRQADLSISMQLAVYGVFCVVIALSYPSVVFLAAVFLGSSLGFRQRSLPS